MTRLAANVTNSSTTIPVESPADFPASGNYAISVDAEIMLVTGGQGTTNWFVTRGYNGTTAVPHGIYATVKQWQPSSPPYPGESPLTGMSTQDKSRRDRGYRQPAIVDVRVVGGSLGDINVAASTEYDGDSVFVGPAKGGAVAFNDAGTWRIVSGAHPLPVNASVTASTPFVTHQRGAALVGSTVTVTLLTVAISVDVTGFSFWGEGDGFFQVMVGSTVFYQFRTNWQNPSMFIQLPGRHQFASGLDLKVTNLSDNAATYSGVVLSE